MNTRSGMKSQFADGATDEVEEVVVQIENGSGSALDTKEDSNMDIVYRYWPDDAALFGPDADMDEIDVQASYSAYEQAVELALREAYPLADVTVESGPDTIQIDGHSDHDDFPGVSQVIHDTWEVWGWVVYK